MAVWGRLDRAILRDLRGPLLLGIAGFSLVMLLNVLFVLARRTIEKHVPLDLMIGFLLAALPRILMFTIPMGVLLAVLVGIGRLATQSELIALRASTVGPLRIFRPVAVLALFMAGVGMLCSQVLMPIGWAHERALMRQIIRVQDLNREIDPGVFYDRLPGTVLYARGVAESPQGRIFRGLFVFREKDDGSQNEILVATRGRGDFDPETGRRSVLLDDGQWHTFEPAKAAMYQTVFFNQCTVPFAADAAFEAFGQASTDDPGSMRLGPLLARYAFLKEKRARAKDEGERQATAARIRRAGLELHRRMSLPLAAVGLAFAAFPLAARSRRGGKFAGMSQALMIILVFYVALSTGWAMSERGKLPVWLGPWMPVILAAIWGGVLWARLRRAETGAARTLGAVLVDAWRDLRAGRRARRASAGRPSVDGPVGPSHRTATQPVGGDGRGTGSPRRAGRRWVFGRLDLFLGIGYLKMVLAVLFVLLTIFLALAFKDAIEAVDPQAKSFPWTEVLRFVGLVLVTQLRYVVPIAALFGAAISLTALSRTGEIVALKAAGIGPARIAMTLMTASALVAGVYALAQETVLPVARREADRTLDRIRGKSVGPELAESGRRWMMGEDSRVWNYLDWDARRQILLAPAVTRVDFERARVVERIEAAQVRRIADRWVFENGWRRTFGDDGGSFEAFKEYRADLAESPELFGEARSRWVVGDALADQLTAVRLYKNLQQSGRTGYPAAPLVVGLNEKLVFPLLPLALVLVAVPLTVSGWQRRGGLQGFGIAIVVVFAYYVAHAISTSLGREAIVNPVVITWLPIAVLFAVGIGLLRRAR